MSLFLSSPTTLNLKLPGWNFIWIFLDQKPVPEDKIIEQEHRAQWFDFPATISNSMVQRAILWIYLNKSQSILPPEAEGSIVIYEIARDNPSLLTVRCNISTSGPNFDNFLSIIGS